MINIPYEDAALLPEPGDNWKTPVILSLVVHLLVLLLALLPATFFEPNLHLEEIYTVDLFDVLDSGGVRVKAPEPPAPPASKADKPEERAAPPPLEEPLLTEAPAEPRIVSTAEGPQEIISLNPRLRKKDLREKEKIAAERQEEKLAGALERIKAELHRKQAVAEAEAAAAAAVSDALAKLRVSIHGSGPAAAKIGAGTGTAGGPAGHGGGQVLEAALKQYYIAVSQHIHRNWILPELQDWSKKKGLTAVYVVHVRRDGIVGKSYFESKSKDYYFNQFVEKTMRESLPLPPFPAELKENELEIGLVFHPSGLE